MINNLLNFWRFTILNTIIGIVGTLLGTILGWVLNTISRKGKLNIYFTSWEHNFACTGELGEEASSSSLEESELYRYRAKIDIFNNSADTMIMRDIKIVFRDHEKTLFESIPYDPSTGWDKTKTINAPARTIISVKLNGGYSLKNPKNRELFILANNVCLSYNDGKNKNRSIFLNEIDYKKHFE